MCQNPLINKVKKGLISLIIHVYFKLIIINKKTKQHNFLNYEKLLCYSKEARCDTIK